MKRNGIFAVLYYLFVPLVFELYIFIMELIFGAIKDIQSSAIFIIMYIMIYLVSFALLIILMRLSLLKWYVDPIAALEIPILIYINNIIAQMSQGKNVSFSAAKNLVNLDLSDDGNFGWYLMLFLFLIGLVASISVKRKQGKSISFRLISRQDSKGE